MHHEDRLIRETIVLLATARGITKTICPSEVARKLWPDDWRDHMTKVRDAAFELRDNETVHITQKGKVISGNNVAGPIRIRIV